MRTTFALAVVLVLSLLSVAILAQESRGKLTGRVADSSGAVLSGATVRAINSQTGAAATAQTNESGLYTIPYLLPGTYTLSAEMTGFKKTDRPGIEVRVNDVLNVECNCKWGTPARAWKSRPRRRCSSRSRFLWGR